MPPYAHQVEHGGRQGGKTAMLDELIARAAERGCGLNVQKMTQTRDRLHRSAKNKAEITDRDLGDIYSIDRGALDAMTYANVGPMRTFSPPKDKTLNDFSDAELVMHMIARGYAVMKLPKAGGLPDTLKD